MGAELENEVVVDDRGCRSRSQVVQVEALSKSVSAVGGERAGRQVFLKVLGRSRRGRYDFGGPMNQTREARGFRKHRVSPGTRK